MQKLYIPVALNRILDEELTMQARILYSDKKAVFFSTWLKQTQYLFYST